MDLKSYPKCRVFQETKQPEWFGNWHFLKQGIIRQINLRFQFFKNVQIHPVCGKWENGFHGKVQNIQMLSSPEITLKNCLSLFQV